MGEVYYGRKEALASCLGQSSKVASLLADGSEGAGSIPSGDSSPFFLPVLLPLSLYHCAICTWKWLIAIDCLMQLLSHFLMELYTQKHVQMLCSDQWHPHFSCSVYFPCLVFCEFHVSEHSLCPIVF